MGFSSSFEDSAHESFILRDDAELNIMDCMKKTFLLKAKSDRDYALNLAAVAQQGLKFDRNDEELGGCLATAWRAYMKQTDHLSKELKINAEKIETLCLQFSQLMQDKRKARKIYCEEHNSVADRLNHLTVECARKKSEYVKNLDAYKSQRTRFEEHYVKSGRSGRKLEDVREKYQKACRKLHLTHNEYVLLLFEAVEVERDFRTVLLPRLLDYQQSLQKNFILLLKSVMQEMIGCCHPTSDKFKEIHRNTLTAIDNMDPVEKYGKLRERKEDAVLSSLFQFDNELLEDKPTKLRSNSLAVDNLTVGWLRSKLADLESFLKECQQHQRRNNYQNNERSCFTSNAKEPGDNKHKQSTQMVLQGCLQQQKLKLANFIRAALNQVGCEENVPECEDLAIELNFVTNDRMKACSSKLSLHDEEWFHGVLPREEVVRLLKNEGDFLVRQTLRNDESQIVLSVCWNGHKHFIVQKTPAGLYRFEGPSFCSIQELINHQCQSELPVTVKSGTVLKKPIVKEVWELSNDDVLLVEKIGKGNFGDVFKAKLMPSKLEVAVKTCKVTLPEEQKRKFLNEGRILKQYNHPNIVKLIGICVQKQPIMIVMELVPGGSLLNYLRNNANSLTIKQMNIMCRDAAAGMQYLQSKNCIHRDLAARNCLIDHKNTVKISDFGMSRDEAEYIVSDGMKQIPVKWTAPEALHFGKYTILCDVWSYGVLLWEIFSKGDTPYSGMSNSKARELIDAGYRMPAPPETPVEVYRLMLKCWSVQPESRPHFDEIYANIDLLINHEHD